VLDPKSIMKGRSKVKIGRKPTIQLTHKPLRSQVRTASVSKPGPQLVAPPVEYVYKYQC